ncbi:ubiquitin carboxyl-terminal hydrolase 19-like isoform X2 [Oppia nitens]|uniref:ubiquitin carboxyl-terminal hydrolase 19-like isoform X2 n=1 Tax=Oppia nitens TaxID=1686743 RepID=UPI0023DC68C6|nr:ubiquitin carboxyl-terminal hydrolase 19-like isoform X2 [Oppia nitens]
MNNSDDKKTAKITSLTAANNDRKSRTSGPMTKLKQKTKSGGEKYATMSSTTIKTTTISMVSDDDEEESYETRVQRKNVTNSGNNCVKTIANNVCSTTTAQTIITNGGHKFADNNVDNNGIVNDQQVDDPMNTDDDTIDEAFANGNGTHLLPTITKVADINDNNDTNSMSMDTNGWPSEDNMTDNDPNTNLILNGSTGDQLTPIDDNNYENEGKENEDKVMDEEVEEQEDNNNKNIVDVSTKIRTDFTEVEDKIVVYLYTKVHKRRIIDIKYFKDVLQVRYKGQEFDPMDITNDTDDNVVYKWRKTLHGQIEPELCHHKETKATIEITVIKKDKKFKWNALERTVSLPFGQSNVNQYRPVSSSSSSSSSNKNYTINKVDDNTSSTVMRPKLFGFTGLKNFGNTCFMNSVVQCLSNTDPFRDYFTSGVYIDDINTTNPLGSGGVLCKTFAEVMRQLWTGTEMSIAPYRLKDRMGEKCATFSTYMQQDAQEFCAYLLDVLHEDLNKRRERPKVPKDDDNNANEEDEVDDQILADESWHRFGLRNDSIVTQLFYGQYKSKLVCPTCSKISVTFDPFVYLSLPLPKPKVEYEVYFYRRDSNGMATSKPVKYTILLAKDSLVQTLLDEISQFTGVKPSSLRCLQSHPDGSLERFLQPMWPLKKPETGRTLLVFELMAATEPNESVCEFFVVQRIQMPLSKPDTCSYCDKTDSWGDNEDLDLQWCEKCYRVVYCSKDCQTSHWAKHSVFCVPKPLTIAQPFVITVPKSQLTYRNLVSIIYSYARHSVELNEPLNLNEFPIPSPFELRVYRDLAKGDKEELIVPASHTDNDNAFDNVLNIENYYWIAMDWKNSPNFGDNWLQVNPLAGINCIVDMSHRILHNNEDIKLEDCLELHTKPEVLTSDNPWYCPKCKEDKQAIKQITLWRLPQILIIQLKRFSFRNIMWREKLDSMVSYPIRGLDMSKYYVRTGNVADCNPIYDLYAVINHYGGLFGGHYTADSRTSNGHMNLGWRSFNDSHVEAIDENSLVTRNAYMLFYKLREN